MSYSIDDLNQPPVRFEFLENPWRENLAREKAKLDPEQTHILEEVSKLGTQPLVAIAGAGSGKTATLVTTVGHVVGEDLARPHEVIFTTFTRKARQEIIDRLQPMVNPSKWASMRVSTFHALALRYMRSSDPQMPTHAWNNDRNIDVDNKKLDKNGRDRVTKLVERISSGLKNGGENPNLRDHGLRVIRFLVKESAREAVGRGVFGQLFGDGALNDEEAKLFRKLWSMFAIPSSNDIWRRICGDWEIPGLETGEVKYDSMMQQELPVLEKGFDLVVPGKISAKDYSGAVEIMRGNGWTPDSPQAIDYMAALDKNGLRRVRDVWTKYEEVKQFFDVFDFADVLHAYWSRGLDSAKLVIVDECFPGDTPILLADGNTMSIRDITESTEPVHVLSWDAETKQQVTRRVVGQKKVLLQKPTVRITAWLREYQGNPLEEPRSERRRLVLTEDHRLFRWDGQEVAAGDVRLGDQLHFTGGFTTPGSVAITVESVEVYPIPDYHVYDLSVEGTHCYYANGFLVHNCQDNNFVQLDVARKVAERGGGTLCLCGDIRQAIYGFRGAAPGVTANAPETIGARILEITTNYRSGEEIVALGNAIAQGRSWSLGTAARSGRRDASGEPVHGLIEMRGYENPIEEATETALEVKRLLAEGRSPQEIAILTRTNAEGFAYEVGFVRARVPVMVLGSTTSFFEHTVIKDALALCMLAESYGTPSERVSALMRVWKIPTVRGKPFMYLGESQFRTGAQRHNASSPVETLRAMIGDSTVWQKKNGGTDFKWLEDARGLLDALMKVQSEPWPARVKAACAVIQDPPYLRGKKAETESNADTIRRCSALESVAETFDSLGDLFEFSRRIVENTLFFDDEETMTAEQKQAYESERARRIVVSTVHKAKGLGWERVYVSSSAGIFPSDRSKTEEETEEEIRVFYVAATRAKLEAIFTYAEKISGKEGGPSSYLTDYVEPFTAKGLELPRVDGWTILSVSDPVRYERQSDGELVEATKAEDGMWSIWLVDVAGPKVLLNLVTESELSAALQEALMVQDQPNPPMPIKPDTDLAKVEPVKAKSKSKLSEEDERFLQYLTHMQGEAAPGLSWATVADTLRSDAQLRASILNEVRSVVRQFATAEESPQSTEATINRVLGPVKVMERKPMWVTLPTYPMSQDRPGVGSLVADGRWVSVTRPWNAHYPALVLTGSTLICDFPSPMGTEWVAYRVSEGGTPEAIHQVTARPGSPKSVISGFHAAVTKIKQEVWCQDELQAWLSERSLPEQLAADARYLYEAAASRPVRANSAGRVEVLDADFSNQGKLIVRVLTAFDSAALTRLSEVGFLRHDPSKGLWHLNVAPFETPAPPAFKVRVDTEEKVVAAPKKKKKKS